MAFNPDEYLKQPTQSGFNPDEYLSKNTPENQPEKPGKLRSLAEGIANAATLGYLPEIQAILEPVFVDAPLGRKSFTERRDEYAKLSDQAKQSNPITYGAGNIAGAIGSGLGIAKLLPAAGGATFAQRAGQAAKAGAIFGGFQAPSQVEGEYDPIQLVSRLESAGIGALLGAGTQAAAEGVGQGAQAVSKYFKNKAAKKAFETLGGTPKQNQRLQESGRDVAIGQELLDSGAIGPLSTTGKIAKKVAKLKGQSGEKVGELIKITGDKKVIDGERLAIELFSDPYVEILRKTPGMETVAQKYESMLETLAGNKDMSLAEAQGLRKQIDRAINFSKQSDELRGNQELLYKIRTGIRNKMNDAINSLETAAGKTPTDSLKIANKSYSNLSEAEEFLGRKLGREASNRTFGLTDTLAGLTGLATGATPGSKVGMALAFGALNKVSRSIGKSFQASTFNALGKALSKGEALQSLAQSNPGAYQTVVNRVAALVTGTDNLKSQELDPILKDKTVLRVFQENPEIADQIQDPMRRKLLKKQLGIETKKDIPVNVDSVMQRRMGR